MKNNRLQKYETKIEPEITPEQHKQNIDVVMEMIMAVGAKLPPNQPPVKSSIAELMNELRNGVRRAPVVVQMHDGKTVEVKDGIITEILPGAVVTEVTKDAEEILSTEVTKFDSEELRLLDEIIQNA